MNIEVRVWLDENGIPFIEFSTRKWIRDKGHHFLMVNIWTWNDGHTTCQWDWLIKRKVASEKVALETLDMYKKHYNRNDIKFVLVDKLKAAYIA